MKRRSSMNNEPGIDKKVAIALSSYSKEKSKNKKDPIDQIKDRIKKYNTTEDQLPDNLDEVEIEDEDAKIVSERLLKDTIARQANRYVEQSDINGEGRRPLQLPDSSNQTVLNRRSVKKSKKAIKIKTKEKVVGRLKSPEELIRGMVKRTKLETPKGEAPRVLKIETFEEAKEVGNRQRLFEEQMKRQNRQPDKVYTRIPNQEEEFSWVQEVKMRETHTAQVALMIEAEADIPNLPHVTKSKMKFLIKAADPKKGERPCMYGTECEAYHQWGFCCKEMVSEEFEELILDALSNGENALDSLPREFQMCVICNLKIVTHLYDTNKMGLNKDDLWIIHNFQMYVDVEGEYPSEMTLLGDDEFRGIIAPIIRYDRSNYVKSKENGINILLERASLDFQEGVVFR